VGAAHRLGARELAATFLADPGADPTGGAPFLHGTALETPWAIERAHSAPSGCQLF
jgi:hypothetical protein